RERVGEELLAPNEWQRSKIEILEAQEVEGKEGCRELDGGALHIDRIPEPPALLEHRKARLPAWIEHDDFAIDHALVERERSDGLGHLGEDRRVVVAVSREQ